MDPYFLFDPFESQRPNPTELPKFTPEEESSLLGSLMEGSLGGLSYLGKVLDKTFGGRAARGILGGRPEEIASIIPFSDSLGITNEDNTVSGRDLTDAAGLTTKGDDGFLNDVVGIGAEILLDPSTFVGAAVPKLLAKGGGYAARKTAVPASAYLGSKIGIDPLAVAGRGADWLGRQGRALFDRSVAGATTSAGQDVGRFYTSNMDRLNTASRDESTKAAMAMSDLWRSIGGGSDAESAMLRGSRQFLEGMPSQASASWAPFLNPQQQAELQSILDPLGKRVDSLLTQQQGRGIKALDLKDEFALMFPRSLGEIPGLSATEKMTNPRSVGQQLSGVHNSLKHRMEEFRDLPGGTAQIDDLARDIRFSGPNATMNPLQAEAALQAMLSGTRAEERAGDLATYLRELRPGYAKDQVPLFNQDIFKDFDTYSQRANRAMSSADAVQYGAAKFAEPVADIEARGERYVRVDDLLNQAGLDFRAGKTNVAQQIFSGNKGVNINNIREWAVPESVASDMLKIGQAWRDPASISPVIAMWDKFSNLFKTYVTRVFPAFHVRNMGSGIFNMWRDNALSSGAMGDTFNMIRGGTISKPLPGQVSQNAADATKETLREMIAHKVAFLPNRHVDDLIGGQAAMPGSILGRIPEVGGAPRPIAEDVKTWAKGFRPKNREEMNPLNTAGVMSDSDKFAPVRQMTRLGSSVEDWVRGSHYIALRQQGIAPAEAAMRVNKYHIDYSGLTEAERHVFKRMFPWWSFSSRTLPVILEDLAKNPAKLASTARVIGGSRERGEFVPNYVAEGASVPLPGAPEGFSRFISSFGTPLEDESIKILGSIGKGDFSRAFQQGIGAMQPAIKAPVEIATGRQLFSGRRLDELRPYEFAGLGGLLPEDRARQLSQVIANTPLSRSASALNQLVDERKGLGPTALNLLTGVKVTDVDTDKQKEIASREMLKELLRGESGVRSREDVYVPKDKIPLLDRDEAILYGLLKQIESQIQRRN